MEILFKPKKLILTKKRAISIVAVLVLIALAFMIGDYIKTVDSLAEPEAKNIKAVKSVKIIKLNSQGYNVLPSEADSLILQAVGSVSPATSVDIIALNSGTVRSVNFAVGNEVKAGQLLASLQNNSLAVNYSNAQLGLANTLNNTQALNRMTEDSIKQAEIGVANALKSVQAAKIGLQTAENNLANAKILQGENDLNSKQTAVLSFAEYLNISKISLDQINYIIKAEGTDQMPNIGVVLGAIDSQSLNTARINYLKARPAYDKLVGSYITTDNIKDQLDSLIKLLAQIKVVVDNTITVLDKTVISADFPQSQLSAQRASFTGLRSQIIAAQTNAEKTLQGLKTSGTINKQEIDLLTSSVEAAKNQLTIAEIGHDNAQLSLDRAKQSQAQQAVANKTSLDGARGQLNLIGSQVADLNISAPIGGKIIAKYIEVGQELQPGKPIAQVANVGTTKIEINLPSEDIYKIRLGQTVLINNEFEGVISLISPIADSVTKKVKVEIVYDNQNQDLILGTFVNISIPAIDLDLEVNPGFILVPLSAITITQNESFAFIMKDGEAIKVNLELGRINGTMIEVKGLNDGDDLIIEGNKELEQGSKVNLEL